jgi:hypothetical protein
VGLRFELRGLHLQASSLLLQPTPPVHFALVILEMESLKLFAWASLNLDLPNLSLPISKDYEAPVPS